MLDRMQKDQLTIVLEMARGRIAQPERWTKGSLAKTMFTDPATGYRHPTSPNSAYACCWCAEGAIRWALANYKADEADDYGEYALDDSMTAALREDAFVALYKGAVDAGVPYAVLHHVAHPRQRLDPCEYNDRADTTHAHIIAAFDEAIRELGE